MACGCTYLTAKLKCATPECGVQFSMRYRDDRTPLYDARLRSKQCKKCYGSEFEVVDDGRVE